MSTLPGCAAVSAPSGPSTTSRSSVGKPTIVKTTSEAVATSAGEAIHPAPRSSSGAVSTDVLAGSFGAATSGLMTAGVATDGVRLSGAGVTFTVGRILHAIGLSRSLGPSSLRFAGMVLTWIALVVGIAGVLWFVFIPQQNLVQSP